MANKETKRLGNKGFSLVELIVVIAIMAVLVGVLAPQFIKYVEKSRQGTDITNLDSIKSVVVSYYADKEGNYLPEKVLIDGSSGTYKLTITGGAGFAADAATSDDVLDQGGVKGTAIKGKWTTAPKATWDIQNNTWTYDAASTYYKVNNTNPGNAIVAK